MDENILIIGAGMAGLSIAHQLKSKYNVRLIEKESKPGGLIRCERINGNLYHLVGGHVFNSKRTDVLNWFWGFFKEKEDFIKSSRNAVILWSNYFFVDYPIENHIYQLDINTIKEVVNDLLLITSKKNVTLTNLGDFMRYNYGDTLYKTYFKPYNEKIWDKDLNNIPLSWLNDKLPMHTIRDIICNNFNRTNKEDMVHKYFYYAKKNGSQYFADNLSKELNITYNSNVVSLERYNNKWIVRGDQFDKIIFCGNIKDISQILHNSMDISSFEKSISNLDYHGTTSVLVEIDKNPYSWIYLPSSEYSSHRIICTGNFAHSNNNCERLTAVIEFTNYVDKNEILNNLKKIPFNPTYLAHEYTKYTYPIQDENTRTLISHLKAKLEYNNLFLLGRFAEWEYYNMDTIMGAAIDLSRKILN
ncbi:UDP-galactopyranose mutase [termite gut metagenome]|uniref:UDP-galactopyranose mutase n=1 Tax=termite gut metagenome TaxID=433724 RepID=A0A5J4S8U7_9ZZZZ